MSEAATNPDTEDKDLRGRPCKLTPEVQETICEVLKRGNTIEAAANKSGIGERTYHRWIEAGKRGEEPFLSFLTATQQAITESELDLVEIVRKAAPVDTVNARWMLERRWPGRWGRQRLEIANPDGTALNFRSPEEAELENRLLNSPELCAALCAIEGQLASQGAVKPAGAGSSGVGTQVAGSVPSPKAG